MFKTLEELITVIRKRKISSSDDSYTNKLLNDKKLGSLTSQITPDCKCLPGCDQITLKISLIKNVLCKI